MKTELMPIKKFVLNNGMTVIVRPIHTIPKVSIQLWYGVGSRDEKDSERGIAHLIEHMIFKGTEKLSESDINTITHMLSGSCNAFTSYDFTGYLFNLPSQHWQEALPVMADCMQNCSFKEDMLSSEMKAVIQELKMYRDHYLRTLVDMIIANLFPGHPYHHPVIGYKQDLWSVNSQDLMKFYKKHYVPNNAILIVVGDVDPQDVFEQTKKYFEAIPADNKYTRASYSISTEIGAQSITLYREINQPLVILAFVIPGLYKQQNYPLELIARILGKGKTSKLYNKLVNELELATSVSAEVEDLFDAGLLFIACEPKSASDISAIKKIIIEELEKLRKDGVIDSDLHTAVNQAKMSHYSLMEDFEDQAFEIGKYYAACNNENYLFSMMNVPYEELKKQVNHLINKYLRPTVMHKGVILPLPEYEKEGWHELQEQMDNEDNKILSKRIRTTPVEPPVYAKKLKIKEPGVFNFPKSTVSTLDNGLKVFSFNNKNTPKIDIILDFKVKYFYDPIDKQGLGQFVSKMILEGTKNYTSAQLAQAIESRGISISSSGGTIGISLLKQDLPFALELIKEICTQATFESKELEKVRAQMIARLRQFWDEPRYFGAQLMREKIYKDHPYSKNSSGTFESLNAIKREDLVEFYKTYYSPRGARLAIVGDLEGLNLDQLLKDSLQTWQGPEVKSIEFPKLEKPASEIVDYPLARDQVLLRFARLSVDRKNPDFDKLLLFDQIFGGGVLGSMSSRLFELRERSGLFYTISGSLIAGSDEQPGMFVIQTIVSLDRLEEAQKEIRATIDEAVKNLTEQELQEAKNAVINSLVDSFETNYAMGNAFLFIDRFGFDKNFFDNRAQQLQKITLEEVQRAAANYLKSESMLLVRVGRLNSGKLLNDKNPPVISKGVE